MNTKTLMLIVLTPAMIALMTIACAVMDLAVAAGMSGTPASVAMLLTGAGLTAMLSGLAKDEKAKAETEVIEMPNSSNTKLAA